MAAGQGELPPNLAAILSALSPAPKTEVGDTVTNEHSDEEYDPAQPLVIDTLLARQPNILNARPRTQDIDPATIVEWPAGLRCVSKISSQNPQFASSIKSMIANQRKNELQWYSQRQELKRQQSLRGSSANALSSIMKSIGATTNDSVKLQSPADMDEELRAYDQKVHQAQKHMNNAMTVELKALGVPFFGTSADKVVPDRIDGAETRPGSNCISYSELRDLQRRMISYLEDMYKD